MGSINHYEIIQTIIQSKIKTWETFSRELCFTKLLAIIGKIIFEFNLITFCFLSQTSFVSPPNLNKTPIQELKDIIVTYNKSSLK